MQTRIPGLGTLSSCVVEKKGGKEIGGEDPVVAFPVSTALYSNAARIFRSRTNELCDRAANYKEANAKQLQGTIVYQDIERTKKLVTYRSTIVLM